MGLRSLFSLFFLLCVCSGARAYTLLYPCRVCLQAMEKWTALAAFKNSKNIAKLPEDGLCPDVGAKWRVHNRRCIQFVGGKCESYDDSPVLGATGSLRGRIMNPFDPAFTSSFLETDATATAAARAEKKRRNQQCVDIVRRIKESPFLPLLIDHGCTYTRKQKVFYKQSCPPDALCSCVRDPDNYPLCGEVVGALKGWAKCWNAGKTEKRLFRADVRKKEEEDSQKRIEGQAALAKKISWGLGIRY